MKKILGVGMLLFSLFITMAGVSQRSMVLSIRDEVPAFISQNIWSGPMKKISKTDFEGKLTILDFWGLNCSVCIIKMPYMDSLKKEFGDKIMIIGVSKNTEKEVDSFFIRKKLTRPNFSSIMGDTLFNQWFPHFADPLHVWVDSNAKVIAITHGYNTTREAIRSVLAGFPAELPTRVDGIFDHNHNFLSEQNSFLTPLSVSHSMLIRGTSDVIVGGGVRVKPAFTSTNVKSIQVVNKSLQDLYVFAYGKELFGFNVSALQLGKNDSRIILEVKDTSPFIQPPSSSEFYAKWVHKNVYSYEMVLPMESVLSAYQAMQQDLTRYFPYTVSLEKRHLKHLALVRIPGVDKIKANYTQTGFLTYKRDTFLIRNLSLRESLFRRMVDISRLSPTIIIDKTKYEGNIDMMIIFRSSDLKTLRAQLNKYDLDIVESDDEIDVLVIRDR